MVKSIMVCDYFMVRLLLFYGMVWYNFIYNKNDSLRRFKHILIYEINTVLYYETVKVI